MILHCRDGALSADECDVLSRLHAAGPVDPTGVDGVTLLADGDLAVSRTALLGAAGDRVHQDGWLDRFDAMVAYARRKGWWVPERDAVRVHVEA